VSAKGERLQGEKPLVAKIDPENPASERVVQKVGFEKGETVDGGYTRGGDEAGRDKSEYVWWVLKRS
jgi:RimJ/RimL family protein N-acetyltransferase